MSEAGHIGAAQLLAVALGRQSPVAGEVDQVVAELRRQGLAGHVLARAPAWLQASPHTLAQLKAERTRLAVLHLVRQEALREIQRLPALEGQRLVVLKGLHYALALYAEPELRPMADVDVMLSTRVRDSVDAALLQQGWTRLEGPSAPGDRERKLVRGAAAVELQDALTHDPRFRFDPQRLAARARPLGGGLWGLAWADALAYHAAHQALHGYRLPLVGWIDLVRIADRVSAENAWNEAVSRAQESGALPSLRIALAVAEALGLLPERGLPDLRALRLHAGERLLVARAVAPHRPPPGRWERRGLGWHLLFRVGLADSPASAARAVGAGLVRSVAWARQRLGGPKAGVVG